MPAVGAVRMRRSWLLLIGASLVLSLAIPVIFGGLDSIRAIRGFSPQAILLLLGMILGAWAFNAARIRLLTHALGGSLGRASAVGTVMASEFAAVATPAGAGGPATYVVLLSRHGLSMSDAAAVVAVDQVTDLVFFGTALPIAILLFAFDRGISDPLKILLLLGVLFVIGLLTFVLVLRNYRPLMLAIGRLLHRVPRLRRTRFRLARGVLRFRHSVRVLLRMGLKRLVLLYLYCMGHWMLRYGVLPVIIWLLGEAVPWGYLFAMQGLLLFIGQATFLPGGGGGVEIGFSALLAYYNLGAATTAAALLLWRFCTFYWYLLAGAPMFMLMTGNMAGRLMRRTP
jgi:uncharacterized protein (TIRG00374 family)